MKHKKLQKWAMGAEIFTAITVVVTIGFLAVQTMHNTNALQAQTFQELMRDINDWRSSIRELESGPMMSRYRLEGFDNLSNQEQATIRLVYLELWGIYEAAFFANERNVLGVIEWTRFENMICFARFELVNDFWRSKHDIFPAYAEILTPQFVEYVENQCR